MVLVRWTFWYAEKTWKVFMGKYAGKRFKKYDDRYNPNAIMKFGDLGKPTVAGNWEN